MRGESEKSAIPLRGQVREALGAYLADLNGYRPANLYQLMLSEVELPLLEGVMMYTGGNQSRAAEMLGISRATLHKKLGRYGIR